MGGKLSLKSDYDFVTHFHKIVANLKGYVSFYEDTPGSIHMSSETLKNINKRISDQLEMSGGYEEGNLIDGLTLVIDENLQYDLIVVYSEESDAEAQTE